LIALRPLGALRHQVDDEHRTSTAYFRQLPRAACELLQIGWVPFARLPWRGLLALARKSGNATERVRYYSAAASARDLLQLVLGEVGLGQAD
jgi:hypothetical protein